MRFATLIPATLTAVALITTPALAADPITVTIKDHRFTPETITVPGTDRVRLLMVNEDATPEEFESRDLRVEKFVPPHGRIIIDLGLRKPGDFSFFGDFHPKTAKGVLTITGAR